ncbi:sulfatase-like hydrolase/transferase [Apibacter sp. B3239]|nr:sulfatase-like hydrolase/transferase [Apibacter sp. B3546]MXP12088.1 sulfatase-like hydrolase/transferase [Apibacter sp. B3239]
MKKLVAPFIKISSFYIIVGLILRIVLLFSPVTDSNFSFIDYLKIFSVGLLNDFCVSILIFVFFWIHLIFITDSKFKSPFKYIILCLFLILIGYLFLFKTVFDDYGSAVPKIIKTFVLIKASSYIILLLIPKIRQTWRYCIYFFIFFLYIFLINFNVISEFLFWNEFGVRYNFIAVDYLIYTNEVIGNILESYPIIPMFSALIVISVLITIFYLKKSKNYFEDLPNFKTKLINSIVYIILFIGAIFLLKVNEKYENSDNAFVNELQANGLVRFCNAYSDSSLNYDKFYAKLPLQKTFSLINKIYDNEWSVNNNTKIIKDTLPELHKNVILVTIESMSAGFLTEFGNTQNLTPNLDKLAKEGLFFTDMYATGNRTVRGLESVTLCIPPSPGESLIKRNNNDHMFSTGYLFKRRGYTVQYFYGGYGYFDNMNTFFEGNGYNIIDRSSFKKDEITFANIWGVCDEDMFMKAIHVFDENSKNKSPFFGHIMTVSNHRPFTYPSGKIDISNTSKSREGGVKYTDYAIGRFIEEAKKRPWFPNTVFVFVADHCASSAGKEDIPLDKYKIPAIIYSPGFIKPEKFSKLVSQIDLMPTLFGKLHFSYSSRFYGQDVFDSSYQPRALIATYQKLGYLKDNKLIVLSPNQKIEQYNVIEGTQMKKSKSIDTSVADEAIANYQTCFYFLENNKLRVENK